MTAAWHLKNTLVLVLPGLVLLATVVAYRLAARRRAAPAARPPRTFDNRPEQERSVLDLKPARETVSETKKRESATLPGGSRHILFVDDERHFAESGRNTLTQLGYRVTLMADASEALTVIRGAHEKIDCLITDLSMPGMSGFDLARICRRLLPGVPVILMSSQDGPIAAELLQACGIEGLLPKPFTRQTLAKAVQGVFTGGKDGAKLDPTAIKP